MNQFKLPENLTEWPPEDDLGTVEYKSRISRDMLPKKFHRLITQLKWRLSEGTNMLGVSEAVYVIGLYDDGSIARLKREEMNDSIDVFQEIVDICDATIDRMTFINLKQGRIVILYVKGNKQDKRYPLLYNDDQDDLSDDCYDIIDE